MAWHLRDDLYYCVIDGNAVFLDLPADEYFRLDERANDAFLCFIAGEMACGTESTLEAAHVVVSGEPRRSVYNRDRALPSRRSGAVTEGALRLGDVASALWVQRRVERHLATRSLSAVIKDLRGAKAKCEAEHVKRANHAARILRAFEFAKVLRTAADRCLPRSIALGLCLARIGVHCDVIIGVKLGPFVAHCWVQADDEVLNDSVEEVARFTPILVT